MKINSELNTKDWYTEYYKEFEQKLNGSNLFFKEYRENALSKFNQLSFPTVKDEEWKYTNVTPITKNKFLPVSEIDNHRLTKNDLTKFLFNGLDSYKVTFINGIYSKEFSDIENLPKGILIENISNLSKTKPDLLKNRIQNYSNLTNAFDALNSIYSVDGLLVIVDNGVVVDKPIQVLYLNGDDDKNYLSVPKNIIVAGKNSQVKLITNFYGIGEKEYFTNCSTEIFIDDYAMVDLIKNQCENENSFHIEKVQVNQSKNSVFNHYNFEFGGSIVRNDINSFLNGENIETHYYGLTLANKNQHIDNHTFVDHAKPNCISNEVYKAILDDNAHGVFNGKIIVRKDAQKTNAYQQNKTILLSKKAKIDTKPQLEIFADDVKCSHGATVGHLDDEAYFYIRTRGIPDDLAKSILIRAFANDVVDALKIDLLKEQINHKIFEHLNRIEVEND